MPASVKGKNWFMGPGPRPMSPGPAPMGPGPGRCAQDRAHGPRTGPMGPGPGPRAQGQGPWAQDRAHGPRTEPRARAHGPRTGPMGPEPGPWAHDDTPAYHVSRIEILLRIMILRRIDLAFRTYQTYHVSRIGPLSFEGSPALLLGHLCCIPKASHCRM